MFYLGEYLNTVTVAAVATTLLLGGWRGPAPDVVPWLWPLLWFLLKVLVIVYVYIWSAPRSRGLRYDRLMAFGWKVLIPIGLAVGAAHRRDRRAARRVRTRRGRHGVRDRRRADRRDHADLAAVREAPKPRGGARPDERRRTVAARPAGLADVGDRPKGMATVFRQIFRRDVTEEYPKEIEPPPPRSHIGRHLLNRHENGLEKCIGCELCALRVPGRRDLGRGRGQRSRRIR